MLQVITKQFYVLNSNIINYILNFNIILKLNISVIMAKNIRIIGIHSMIISTVHWVISRIKFLPLVDLSAMKLNNLISTQIHGQQKFHFLSALSKYIFELYF